MDERDHASLSAGADQLASEVAERVRSIISAAEAAANAVRHEAEQSAQVRLRSADEEARRLVEEAKKEADARLAERIRRISELSDSVVERAESILARLDRAEEVRRQLQSLADALGESAQRLAHEMRSEPIFQAPPAPAPETAAPPPQPAQPPVEAAPPPMPPPVEPEPVEPHQPTFEPRPPEPAAEERVAPPQPEVAPQPEAAAEEARLSELRPRPAAEPRPGDDGRESDELLGARLVALQMAVAGGSRGDVESHLRATFGIADSSHILDDVFGRGTSADKRVAWPERGGSAA